MSKVFQFPWGGGKGKKRLQKCGQYVLSERSSEAGGGQKGPKIAVILIQVSA